MTFEVANTQVESVKRLIIYREDTMNNDSIGYKVDKKDLYALYSQLKELFRNDEVI